MGLGSRLGRPACGSVEKDGPGMGVGYDIGGRDMVESWRQPCIVELKVS